MSGGVNKAFIFILGFSTVVPSGQEAIAGRQKMLSKEDIIDPSAGIELIADTFQFTEGPASDKNGNVYFSDIQASRIYVLNLDGQLTILREPSGRANGLKFDYKGNLLACEGASRSVTSTSPEGKVTVLADRYLGKKLNSPNDLWVDPKGGIYFTDPRYEATWIWKEKDRMGEKDMNPDDNEEQEIRGLYYLPPDGRPLRRVAEGFLNPNGVVGTVDRKKLYVSDTYKKETYVFDILEDGSLANRRIFIPEYSDGMTLDERNNVYLTNGGVKIYTPDGKLITTIDLPCKASNVCFGGRDHKTLFITARQGVFSLQMKVSGQ
jgi:gluconolactonase